jgi:hypothetical protein
LTKTPRPERPFWSDRTRQRLWWLFVIVVILLPFVLTISSYRASLTSAELTVDRRECVTNGSGDSVQSYYLVWTQEGEVFLVVGSGHGSVTASLRAGVGSCFAVIFVLIREHFSSEPSSTSGCQVRDDHPREQSFGQNTCLSQQCRIDKCVMAAWLSPRRGT